MARLFTCGAEGGHPHADGLAFAGMTTASTTVARSGSYSLKFDTTSPTAAVAYVELTTSTTSTSFRRLRVWFYLPQDISASAPIVRVYTDAGGIKAAIRLNTDRTLDLVDGSGNIISGASTSSAMALNTWFSVEFQAAWSLNTWTFSAAIDGTSIATNVTLGAGAETGSGNWRVGWNTAPAAAMLLYADDIALNDSLGGVEDGNPARTGKIVFHKIIAISPVGQLGSWTGGAGGTNESEVITALSTLPPAGTATETNTTQMESASTSGSNTFSAQVESYTTKGIGASDTITLTRPMCIDGEDVGTGDKTAEMRIVSNPTQAPGSYTFTVAVAGASNALGTYPTNWFRHAGLISYAPSVTLGSSPVVSLVDTDTSNRVQSYCLLGLLTEYVPAIPFEHQLYLRNLPANAVYRM